jgi:hypothetical protein
VQLHQETLEKLASALNTDAPSLYAESSLLNLDLRSLDQRQPQCGHRSGIRSLCHQPAISEGAFQLGPTSFAGSRPLDA